MEQAKSTEIEKTTCSRCYGTGKYSYNQIHGDRCYGCGGRGFVYTKRGKVAAEYLESMRKIPAKDFKVGDLVRLTAGVSSSYISDAFYVVTEVLIGPDKAIGWGYRVGHENEIMVLIKGERQSKDGTKHEAGIKCYPDQLLRKGFTKDEKQEQIRKALEFQDTLTKAGTPRKRLI